MPALRGLAVSLKNVDDDALSLFPRFPALRQLMPMDVTDDGFRHIGLCRNLEKLWCMYCRDTGDRATEHLAALSSLKLYYAGMTKITDRSLEILAGINSLEELEFWQCAGITTAGIARLAAPSALAPGLPRRPAKRQPRCPFPLSRPCPRELLRLTLDLCRAGRDTESLRPSRPADYSPRVSEIAPGHRPVRVSESVPLAPASHPQHASARVAPNKQCASSGPRIPIRLVRGRKPLLFESSNGSQFPLRSSLPTPEIVPVISPASVPSATPPAASNNTGSAISVYVRTPDAF